MNILIDKNRLLFLGKHESSNALLCLAWLQAHEADCAVLECDNPFQLNSLTDFQLKSLYKNTTDVDHVGFNRAALLSVVHEVITRMEVSDIVVSEIEIQAASIPESESDICYRYVKGSFIPEQVSDIFEPDGIRLVRDIEREAAAVAAAPAVKRAYDAIAPPIQRAYNTPAPRSSAPRSDGPAEAPKSGSKTGKVWEVADAILAQHAQPVADIKALRRQIVAACEAEGINGSTASVQYGKWKNSKGL